MKENSSKITNFILLTVFCVFALCILLVLLTGADVYRRMTDRQEEHFDRRTAVQYIATRVRQGDAANLIKVEDFGGYSALVIGEEIDGQQYCTRVYCCDGYIRELFTAANGNFSPEDGERILKAEQVNFDLNDSVLTVDIVLADGTYQRRSLYLRSETEGIR